VNAPIFGSWTVAIPLTGTVGLNVLRGGTVLAPGNWNVGTDPPIVAATDPILTAGTQVRLENAGVAMRRLVAAAANLPANAALTTWAQWAGTNFGRVVFNYTTGSRIIGLALGAPVP
jgi:hypothetical protein